MTTVSPRRLAWLDGELAAWRSEGLIGDDAARAIRGRYVVSRRFSLARLLLALGAGFVAAGLIWLVAANLDRMPPLLRFSLVLALWLGLVVAAEVLAERRGSDHGSGHGVGVRARGGDPVVGAVRGLAAGAFGALVFQAAQSLQVPAYAAALVGWWGLGALLYAYAVDGVAPLLVGIGALTVWFPWQVGSASDSFTGFVTAVLLAAAVATALAVLHARWRAEFAPPWRVVGALLALAGAFVAALPVGEVFVSWPLVLIAGAIGTSVLVGAALVLGPARDRLEAAVPVLVVLVGAGLAAWQPESSRSDPSAAATTRALLSVLAYLLIAGWYAVLGVRRDVPALTGLATAALVLFTTVQSFAVFAPIISGASLFLAVGLVLLVSGYGFDRARRRLVASVDDTDDTDDTDAVDDANGEES